MMTKYVASDKNQVNAFQMEVCKRKKFENVIQEMMIELHNTDNTFEAGYICISIYDRFNNGFMILSDGGWVKIDIQVNSK